LSLPIASPSFTVSLCLAAQATDPGPADSAKMAEPDPEQDVASSPTTAVPCTAAGEESIDADPSLWLYRDRTVALLRRYLRFAVEVGRLPSLVGREFFRSRVTSYRTSTFEDAVIFVHDVERSLELLDDLDRQLIAKITLQEYSQEEAARLIGCGYRTAHRRYPEALDRMSEILLARKILDRLPASSRKPCQEAKTGGADVSDSIGTK